MEQQNYTTAITVNKTAQEVFNAINSVSKWWSKEISGSSSKLNDEFILRADRHYSKQKLVEFVPNKKVVWLVTDSKLDWITRDKTEWTGTKMVFELISEDNSTTLKFTHEGLVPSKECYEHCAKFWQMIIKDWLSNFIINGASERN